MQLFYVLSAPVFGQLYMWVAYWLPARYTISAITCMDTHPGVNCLFSIHSYIEQTMYAVVS